MRKAFTLLLLAAATLPACTKLSPAEQLRHRAIDSVETYLEKHLNDPGSYEDLGYGTLKKDKPFTIDTMKFTGNGYTIRHSYRAKNGFGALIKYDQKVVLSKNFKVEELRDLPE